MFSVSMMASSTTTPIATAIPASTIVLIVAPRRESTTSAAITDSGIVTRLMNAARHWNRKAISTRITRMQPMISATLRLWSDESMNVAGRKMWVSVWMPGSPG